MDMEVSFAVAEHFFKRELKEGKHIPTEQNGDISKTDAGVDVDACINIRI